MIVEVSDSGKLFVHVGMEMKDWINLVGTINNQDEPISGDADFHQILEDLRDKIPVMEHGHIEHVAWTKLGDRYREFVVLNVEGEWKYVSKCKKCSTTILSKFPLPVSRCLTCGGGMQNVGETV